MGLTPIVLSFAIVSQSGVDTTVRDRFLKEYPGALAELEARMSPVKGVARVFDSKNGNREGPGNPITFAVDGTRRKFEFSKKSGKGKDVQTFRSVYCMDDLKSFRLGAVGEAPYRIEAIGLDPVAIAVFRTIFGKYVDAPRLNFGTALTGLMNNSDFQLNVAREIDTGHGRIVEVQFDEKSPGDRSSTYRVRLDPGIGWAIVESEHRLGSPSNKPETMEIEYPADLAGGRIFPSRIRSKRPDGKETICEFEQVEFAPTPEGEFRMEHYGLKDVTQYAPRRPSPIYGWLAWAGIVVALFAASVTLKRASDRRR